MSGRSVLHAMSMLVPPAWRSDNKIPQNVADFYEYAIAVFVSPGMALPRFVLPTGSPSLPVWIGTAFDPPATC